ncbi:oocyte zinc finger protein XlCOF6-like [Tribolium madens]|uniref:oocyte zinc finger protein XlCOF6-like n=1 Tax=Tribolium madens TaxID=41895 RepID=UPI001CF73895|nr:oocyte zinc finger protein XlCOF6-like [Tribolium madens]
MSDKSYPNGGGYAPLNNVYNRAPCPDSGPNQQFYSYNMPINNNYNQLEAFNMISPQNYHKNQNVCMYPELPSWDSRIYEDTLKIPDKIEMIEITSKDLSPASFCSNLDLLVPDFYKSLGKDLNYFNKFEGFGGNQKIDFPSCAQSNQGGSSQTVKYCSIQNIEYHNYGGVYEAPGGGQEYYNYYDNGKILDQNQYFDLPPLDQQTESNDESDIIVEESDEDCTTDYEGKKVPSRDNKCIICNVSYTPLGTQFYFLTLKSPLTMSSQKPVFTKIVSIVGKIRNDINYLCSECLGLINTIDHLQLKLDGFNMELLMKFKRTCQENNKNNNNKRKKRPQDRKMKCKLCKKIISLRQICENHTRKHKFKGFLCELCGEISPTWRRFRLHYQQHKTKPLKIAAFVCSNCPKSFRTRSNLIEHENYCLGLLPHNCKFCDKKFPSSTKLKNHVRLKHDKKFIAICSICNIGFVKLSDYKAHKISHSTDKKFSCTKCDKTYKTLSNLNFHMKVHSGKLPFICTICDKGFMRKEYLEAHVNNHNGVKNFGCHVCNKKFVSQKNLDSHLKYHDGSAKTRTCNICSKVMTSGFEEHLRIHNNLREFECDQCDSKFNTKGTLAKHKKRKHVNKTN